MIAETERLRLRTWTLDDAEAAHAFWGDPEVMRYVGAPHADVAATRRALERAIAAQDEHGVSVWPVIERASGALIGCCGFHRHVDLELVFHFARAHWGKGYATEAAAAALGYAFDTLGAARVEALHHRDNAGSARVLDKLGFRRIGEEDGAPLYELRPS